MLIDKRLDYHHTVLALTEVLDASGIELAGDTYQLLATEIATGLGRRGIDLVQTNEDNPVKAQAATFLSRAEDTA